MAITRKLNEITLNFDREGNPTVLVTAIVTDTDEGTNSGAARILQAPAVLTAATALRDACLTLAANAGKPLSF